ncbi:MAG: hypothetical protein ACR2JF_12360 [Iamia sp.]
MAGRRRLHYPGTYVGFYDRETAILGAETLTFLGLAGIGTA